MSRSTPDTARTVATCRCRMPPRTGNSLTRSRISTSVSAIGVLDLLRSEVQPTPHLVPVLHLAQVGFHLGADLKGILHSGIHRGAKRQPLGKSIIEGTTPGMTSRRSRSGSQDGDGADQAPGIGVQRVLKMDRTSVSFHDLAGVHDRYPVSHLGHDPQIVGDEDHRGVRVFWRSRMRSSI